MANWPTRGRPKSASPKHDMGTPELLRKKKMGVTEEIADLCLKKGIFTREEHWCAMHFRWLYTVRYGLPTISAINLEGVAGSTSQNENEDWKAKREEEFSEAANALKKCGAHREVINLAVLNNVPPFLLPINERNFRMAENALGIVRDGLSALQSLWLKGDNVVSSG